MGPLLFNISLWLAKHRLQKVCICSRSSSHACWWRLTSSGRSAKQRHGNRRWIPPDLQVKAQHYKNGIGSLPSQQEAKRELKDIHNNETLPLFSERKYLRSNVGYRRHFESLHKSWHHVWHSWGDLLARTRVLGRNVANSHHGPGSFNSRVLRSCLVLQCSPLPHWLCHQRRLANCYWMPASYSSGKLLFLADIQPTLSFVAVEPHLSLARHAMKRGLHSALTCPPGGNAWRLRHSFELAEHQFISSSENNNNRNTALSTVHRWNAEWLENTTKLRTFLPTSALTFLEWPCQEQRGSGLIPSALCGLWVWRRRTDR